MTVNGMCKNDVQLKYSFAWYEKLSMRIGMAVAVGIGTFAIYQSDPVQAAGYLSFVVFGVFVVMYDSLCMYCPHPAEHEDCLLFPHQFVASGAKLHSQPIPRSKKVFSALAFLGIVAIPQYWLWGQWSLLALFWLLTVSGGVFIYSHFCRRCRRPYCAVKLVPPKSDSEK